MELFKPDNFSVSEIKYKSTDYDQKLFDDILVRYFNQFEIKEVLRLDRNEINSENYQIVFTADGKNKRLLLRRYKNLQDKTQIDFYLELTRELNKRNVPVGEVALALDGGFSVAHGGDVYALFEFIDAQYFSRSEAQLAAVGRAIGEMHRALNELPAIFKEKILELSKKGKSYFNKVPVYDLVDFQKIEKIIKDRAELNAIDELVLASLSRCFEVCREVVSRRNEWEKIPGQLTHSDLHPHNVLFSGDNVAAIIDFDSIRVSTQARDAAFALYRFGRQFLAHGEKMSPVFLKSYENARPLSEEERRLLPILLKDDFLRKILFVLRGVYEEGNEAWAKDLPKFFAALEEIDYFF